MSRDRSVLRYALTDIASVLLSAGQGFAARRAINEFRRDVEWTRRAYPGIERRRVSLEDTFDVVERRAKEALRQVRSDADRFVGRIMHGSNALGNPLRRTSLASSRPIWCRKERGCSQV